MPSYSDAIFWIAHNDEPDDLDPEHVAGYISTLLAADLFRRDPMLVAIAIVATRQKHMTKAEATAWAAGYETGLHGGPRSDNPYHGGKVFGNDLRGMWDVGFNDGEHALSQHVSTLLEPFKREITL